MDEIRREEIANQRFTLIAPIVKLSRESMGFGERYAILRKIAAGKYPGLELPKGGVGLRTLERYLEHYERGGIEALKPKLRHRSTLIPKEYLDEACRLKRENLSRSIAMIITMLEQSGRVPNGLLKPSTVYDYFTKQKLTRPQTGFKTGYYTRYGASYRGEILQGDSHHTLKLPDPSHSGQQRQVFLFAWIDDYSRLAYGRFYWKERLPALEDSLMKWVILYGCPESVYCDNGAVYSSHHLQNICATLGIQLHHSKPYRPQGRGKIEKFFQLVESSFKSEVELLIKQEKLLTLTDLNNLFAIWLDRFYNRKIHSATKQTPLSRWEAHEHPLKKLPLETIYEAFLWKEERNVSKTGIISVESNEYEVEPFLCGKTVVVRYDPYDLAKGIKIYYEGKQYRDAIPAKIHRHSKKGFDREILAAKPPSGLNFLEQLAQAELPGKQAIKFSSLEVDKS
ncbi:MAG: DDE-type integrase/transposase/recombinase [Firmicutes bacterium]|nr:DDE-type integrase/transposase/recombinase [Bacillota bacterium]